MTFYSVHTHSVFSANDALPTVKQMVHRAAELQYPALGLTDHRTVAGSVQLYRECRKAGIEPLPGCEFNVAWELGPGRPPTYHMGVLATTERGYRNLCRLATLSNRQFHYIPVLDMGNIARLGEAGCLEGLVCTTGCWFGIAVQPMVTGGDPTGIIAMLARYFDQCYVEVQAHAIERENEMPEQQICDELVRIADHLSLPVVVTLDSHYTHREHQHLHDAYKKVVSWGDGDDAVFPGDGYHMDDINWVRMHHEPHVVARGLDGLDDLLKRAHVVIPELDEYTLRTPDMGDNPLALLRAETRRMLRKLHLALPEYRKRLTTELHVIGKSGFASYLVLVAQVCREMRDRGIWYTARGSASGSLVCYLMGITALDPLAWKLRFDRFLSTDRTKPPDVDLDVEHERRGEVVEWLARRYPTTHVGTWLTYSLTEKTDKVTGEVDHRGSLRVRYFASKRRRGQEPGSWADVDEDSRDDLLHLSALGLHSGYGVHAAGLVVAPDGRSMDDLPLGYVASSKTFVTQYGKDDVEALGYVKLDVLGSKTLTAMHLTYSECGVYPDEIPLNDAAVYRRLGRGHTVGIFQLEGYASQRGVRDMKPRTIHHVIASMALFRPAAMQSGATKSYVERLKRSQKVPQMHPDITEECGDTYMVLLYQEQVIGVLRRLGMEVGPLNAMLKAVKASNAAIGDARGVIAEHLPMVHELAVARGWSESDVAWLVDALVAFASYSFNKAHATAYGLMAYRTAWYAEHHPVAFWASMMTVFGENRPEYLPQARADGVRIAKPHVNHSRISYTPDTPGKQIRKGLLSIHGVGEVAAEELSSKAPFVSLRDLGMRVNGRKVSGSKNLALGRFDETVGIIKALDAVGALKDIPEEVEEPDGGHTDGET